jgi:hypothetical protein
MQHSYLIPHISHGLLKIHNNSVWEDAKHQTTIIILHKKADFKTHNHSTSNNLFHSNRLITKWEVRFPLLLHLVVHFTFLMPYSSSNSLGRPHRYPHKPLTRITFSKIGLCSSVKGKEAIQIVLQSPNAHQPQRNYLLQIRTQATQVSLS